MLLKYFIPRVSWPLFRRGLRDQLHRLATRRRYQLMIFLLLVMSWLAMEVYHTMVVKGLPLAIVDHDNSKISRTVKEYILANREVRLVDVSFQTLAEAEGLLVSGELAGVVYIPEDFSADIKKGRKGTVVVSVDMSNILIGKNLYKAVSRTLTTVSVGIQMTVVKKMGEQKNQAMARVLPIAVNEFSNFNPGANYGIYLIPGLLFFFLHVFILILCVTLYLPPFRPATDAELAGGLAANFLVSLAIGLLFFYVFLPYENLPPESHFGVVSANLVVFLLLDIMLAAGMNQLIPLPMVAFESTIVMGMLSLMLCGVTWPADTMPPLIAMFGKIIPFTPFMVGSRMYMHYPIGLGEMGVIFRQYAGQAVFYAVVIALCVAVRRAVRRARAKG